MTISDITGFGEIGKTIIQEIAQGIRDASEPGHIRKKAEAEKDAIIIKSEGEAEALKNIGKAETYIENLKRRSEIVNKRMNLAEEQNLESVIAFSEPSLPSDISSVEIDDLWMYRWIQASKTAFDEQVQRLWAKILTMEIDSPGLFSPRTLSLLSNFSRKDAKLVEKVLHVSLTHNGKPLGILYCQTNTLQNEKIKELNEKCNLLYGEMGLSYRSFLYLDDLSVINFGVEGGTSITIISDTEDEKSVVISFQGEDIEIIYPPDRKIRLPVIPLTSFGEQLALLIDEKKNGNVEKIIEIIKILHYEIVN